MSACSFEDGAEYARIVLRYITDGLQTKGHYIFFNKINEHDLMQSIIRNSLVIFSLLLIWQIIVWLFQFPVYILPGPLLVAKTWVAQWQVIATQAWPTIIEAVLGLILGSLVGIITALLMTLIKPLRHWFLPILLISQALPTFAIAPLLVMWFGYGMASKVVVTMIMLFFPVTSSFYDGLKRTPQSYLDMAQTMGASNWQSLWRIRVPAALPSLASGLRVATAFAPMGAVIGEWVGSSRGLGFLMLNANARMQIAMMFASLMTIIVLALVLYFIVDRLLRYYISWNFESSY